MKYIVHFTDEKGERKFGEDATIEAVDPEDAVAKFIANKEKIYFHCLVVWGFAGKRKLVTLADEIKKFEEKNKKLEEKKKNERNEVLQKIQENADNLKNFSYLELPAEERNEIYNFLSYLSAELEKRPLDKEEIEFLKAWHQLKDREIGEQLLTKNEMSKPKSEQGKSAFSKTAWATGFAMQGMATQNTLNDIADDVSDISDSGGGFD